jgi:cystathionine gamma-synthase
MTPPPTDVPCRPEDLGKPIPATRHAVSVCLPTWADNLGYEQGDARVVGRMRCGYPRFFLHPDVQELFRTCEAKFAAAGECCFAFPSRRVAERCGQFVRTHKGVDSHVHPLDDGSVCCVRADATARNEMRAYWQHTGQIVSSRVAERILAGRRLSSDGAREKATLRERIAKLMNVDSADVWLFPSGMAAIETAFRAFGRLRPAAKSVQFGFPYVDSLKVQERCGRGARVQFFPQGDAGDLARLAEVAAVEPLLGLFCEFPGNPLLASADLRGIDTLARKHDFPVLVDDTLGALVNVDVLPVADVVTCSLTKFFSGAGDVIAGSLVLNSQRPGAGRLREALAVEYEDLLDPEDAAVLEHNSRDCAARVRRINRTAEDLCEALRTHPLVERIDYPKYRDWQNYRAFLRADGGYGGLFSILLKNADRTAPHFFDALQIAKGPNLGTNFSLCCPYTILAHYNELDFVERCGISRYLVRVSVGLEEADWLIGRFRDALERASKEPAG